MTARMPPVPPDQQPPQGGKERADSDEGRQAARRNERDRNLEQQGRQGNIQQNTNNQGRQQDR